MDGEVQDADANRGPWDTSGPPLPRAQKDEVGLRLRVGGPEPGSSHGLDAGWCLAARALPI